MELIAGGNLEQRACLRDTIFPRLDQASPLLCQVAAYSFSQGLAHDLVVDGDFIRLFSVFRSKDVHVRQSVIKELQNHIQWSDEAAHRQIVDWTYGKRKSQKVVQKYVFLGQKSIESSRIYVHITRLLGRFL